MQGTLPFRMAVGLIVFLVLAASFQNCSKPFSVVPLSDEFSSLGSGDSGLELSQSVRPQNLMPSSGPNTLVDWLIQDVCVDAQDNVVAGDPATCAKHRDVKFGESLPYLLSTGWPRSTFNYPVQTTDGSLMIMNARFWSGRMGGGVGDYYGEFKASGFDLFQTNGRFFSIVTTQDQGGGYQPFSQSLTNCTNPDRGWISFPTNFNLSTQWDSTEDSCRWKAEWAFLGPHKYSSGKTLNTIASFHYAGSGNNLGNVEAFYFTKEYGMTLWESWDMNPAQENSDTCPGATRKVFPDGKMRYRWSCGDASNYFPMTEVWINPLVNHMGRDQVLSKNLLSHGDFPGGQFDGWQRWSNTDWQAGVGRQVDEKNGYMKAACWGAPCSGASVFQDIGGLKQGAYTVGFGSLLKMSAASTAASATYVLWFDTVQGSVPVKTMKAQVGGAWKHFSSSVAWDFAKNPVTKIRMQIYLDQAGVEYNIDDVYVTPFIGVGNEAPETSVPVVVDPPVVAPQNKNCALPWGGEVLHQGSVTAYLQASVASGQSCQSQVRSCNNGVLSGSYLQRTCTVTPVVVTPPPVTKVVYLHNQLRFAAGYLDSTRGEAEGRAVHTGMGLSPGVIFSYGPYITLSPRHYDFDFQMMVDVTTRSLDDVIATIEITANSGQQVLAERVLYRRDFVSAGDYKYSQQRLSVNLAQNYQGVEFRVRWHGNTYLRFRQVQY